MSTLDDWIARTCGALDLSPDSLSTEQRNALLDLTRDVAHGVARIAGPLTCYLVGVAVGRGADLADALAKVGERAAALEPTADSTTPKTEE